jgi:hypothetical protein
MAAGAESYAARLADSSIGRDSSSPMRATAAKFVFVLQDRSIEWTTEEFREN